MRLLRSWLKRLVLPPLNAWVLAAIGLLFWRRKPKLGKILVGLAATTMFVFSMPAVGTGLLRTLQTSPPIQPGAEPKAQAIVVLSADVRRGPEFDRDISGRFTLERIRYAAELQRRTGLTVLVSGGVPRSGSESSAHTMAADLDADFGVPVRWLEGKSANTWENARESAAILSNEGIQRVLLVTHAWHMPRALCAFEAAGLEAYPAPTGFVAASDFSVGDFLPNWKGLRDSYLALHEWIGRAWYNINS